MNDDHKYVARRSELARGVEPYARIDDGRAASHHSKRRRRRRRRPRRDCVRAIAMVLRSTRLRRSRIVCVRAPSQHTPKTPWKEEVVSFSLDDDARRRRREANARRRPHGTATNAYIARARVMGGKFVHREPTRWMRTMTESVELGRRFDSRARRRRVRRRRRRSRSSAGKRRAARTEVPRNMGTHTTVTSAVGTPRV